MRIKFGQEIINKISGKEKRKLLADIEKLQAQINEIHSAGGSWPLSPDFKRKTILEYAQEYNCNIFVETGTYLGDTTDSVTYYFDELHTIELSQDLYNEANEKFKHIPKIHCYQGNSNDVLNEILLEIDGKILFWLDAHYSMGITAQGDKDTPILEELEAIFKTHKKCVILIDDARCFTTCKDYPTIFKLKRFILKYYPKASIEVYNDIIRVALEDD